MRVIFIKDVKGQGKAGDIKEVSDGYANNFLLNKGFAVAATSTSIERLKVETTIKNDKEAEVIKNFEKIKKQLEAMKLVFIVKTADKDKVFGSISSKQICSELEKQGFKIDKKIIVLDEHLSSLGVHNIKINLHKKVVVNLKIELVKE